MKKIVILILFSILTFICLAEETPQDSTEVVEPKITFLELGSVSCIPCQQMEKVLESVREKYGDQIEVIFHDVNKEKDMAVKYQIKMIPTQVFLDAEGKEIHRHVGFYPEKLIDEFLKEQGLIIQHQQLNK